MGQDVAVDSLGDEWKGYVVRITGGNDKQVSSILLQALEACADRIAGFPDETGCPPPTPNPASPRRG